MSTRREFSCPTSIELLSYMDGSATPETRGRMAVHIDTCAQCTRDLRKLEDARQKGSPAFPVPRKSLEISLELQTHERLRGLRLRRILDQQRPHAIELGQIWRAISESGTGDELPSQLVAVLVPPDETKQRAPRVIVVAPISMDVGFASSEDLLVPSDDGPLPYPHMVEVWNEITLLDSQLGQFLGALSEPTIFRLTSLYDEAYGLAVDRHPLTGHIGLPLLGKNDPREEFQERELERYTYLREPARQQLTASPVLVQDQVLDTLGDLVRICEPELAISLPQDVLDNLRTDPTPVSELRNHNRQPNLLGHAFQRAAVPQQYLSAAYRQIVNELSKLIPIQGRAGQTIFARRQR